MCYPDQMWAHQDIKPWDGPLAPVLGANPTEPGGGGKKNIASSLEISIASTSFETCESLRNVDWIEMEIWKSLDITGSWQPTNKKNYRHAPATCWNSHPGTDVHAFSLPTTDAPLLRFGRLSNLSRASIISIPLYKKLRIYFRTQCLPTLWLLNIAMENGPSIVDFPLKTSIHEGFSMAMLNNQMGIVSHVFFGKSWKPCRHRIWVTQWHYKSTIVNL